MRPLSLWATRLYLPILLLLTFFVERSRVETNLRGIIWSDAEGYYVYLPGVFNLPSVHNIPEGSMNARKNDWGATVVKYTCGVALFELPFFLVARAYCDARGFDRTDIYNKHYARSVALAGFLACALGLWFLQRILRQLGFREPVVALTSLATLAGTNLFHYVTKEPGMSHVYSFGLLAALLWHIPRFYKHPSWGRAALLGGLLGWLVLIRPTAVMVGLFVLLYDVYSLQALGQRLQWLLGQWRQLLLGLATGSLFLVPQLLYWHEMTGQWVRYSYDGEAFIYWAHPKILEVLFDVQNGLFIYSPVVLLAIVGIGIAWKEQRLQAPALALLFALATYVFASWWAWWFGGAFGHRCYVEYYALLALPLALTFQKMLQWKSILWRSAALAGVGFLIFYGARLAFLYSSLPTPWDGPEWRWNFDKLLWLWSNLFQF